MISTISISKIANCNSSIWQFTAPQIVRQTYNSPLEIYFGKNWICYVAYDVIGVPPWQFQVKANFEKSKNISYFSEKKGKMSKARREQRAEKLKREKPGKMQLAAKQVAYYLAKGGILFCKKRSADDRYKNNSTRSINIWSSKLFNKLISKTCGKCPNKFPFFKVFLSQLFYL